MAIEVGSNAILHNFENSAADLGSTTKAFKIYTNGIIPTTLGVSIGTNSLSFEEVRANLMYAKGIYATNIIDGNVNEAGTSNVVYGAVFN
jgi:hypothetical protein